MRIEVAYAKPEEQVILVVRVEEGCRAQEAIQRSGILERFPEINLAQNKVGIFSKMVELNALLREGDRVEIYRPLMIDPKQARRARAKEQQHEKSIL